MSASAIRTALVALLPGRRADADTYWLALGLVALADGVRMSVLSGPSALFWWLAVLFLVASIHMNRLRDAGRPSWFASAPILGASAAKLMVATGAAASAIFPLYRDFIQRQGVNMSDPEQVNAAFADPELQSAFQSALLADTERAQQIAQAGDWPSMLAFWAVIILGGMWFANLRRP
ncbi:MAG: hypothetical protein AAFX09_12840 [Pseudomonadota bacterium]